VNPADRNPAFQRPRSRSKNRASGSCTGSSWAADALAIKRRSLSKASSNRTMAHQRAMPGYGENRHGELGHIENRTAVQQSTATSPPSTDFIRPEQTRELRQRPILTSIQLVHTQEVN
jgi:hypothetical protein